MWKTFAQPRFNAIDGKNQKKSSRKRCAGRASSSRVFRNGSAREPGAFDSDDAMEEFQRFRSELITMRDVTLRVFSKGEGLPIVFLHAGQGLHGCAEALERFSEFGRVVIPAHPGFAGTSLPQSITGVDDLAFLYLDLLEQLDLKEVIVVGVSFGGWIAAEMAVIRSRLLSGLVLVDSLGIKISDHETRDIVDMHAMSEDDLAGLLYADPQKFRPDYATMSDEDVVNAARGREVFAFLGWRPYMYDPKLRNRLHRIQVPTLVLWGRQDRIVSAEYGRTFSDGIRASQFHVIDQAGHFPHVEQPAIFAQHVKRFVKQALCQRRS